MSNYEATYDVTVEYEDGTTATWQVHNVTAGLGWMDDIKQVNQRALQLLDALYGTTWPDFRAISIARYNHPTTHPKGPNPT